MGKGGGRVTLLSTLAFLFVLGILVLVHEFGHFIVARMFKVRVEIFSIGFGKKIFSLKKRDTEYRISLVPLGGYVKLAGENPTEARKGEDWEMLSKSPGERAAIVSAGPIFNYLIAFVLFSLVFFVGIPTPTTMVGEVGSGYPAEKAGLQKGDRIIAVDGKEVKFWEDLSSLIHSKTEGRQIELEIQRNEQNFTVSIIPKVELTKNIFGEDIKIGLVGITQSNEEKIARYGFLESIQLGAKYIVLITKGFCFAFYRIILGKMSVRASFGGPILIFQLAGRAAESGFMKLLFMTAVLSVNLAIINLFPIPVLDGGHLLFLFFEKLKGKPASIRVQEIAMRIGLSLLVTLMIFVFYNDLARIGFFEKVISFIKGK